MADAFPNLRKWKTALCQAQTRNHHQSATDGTTVSAQDHRVLTYVHVKPTHKAGMSSMPALELPGAQKTKEVIPHRRWMHN